MKKTQAMIEREENGQVAVEWKDEGGGYASGTGRNGKLAYIAIPEDHPDVGADYFDLSPDVNGGLTFGGGNVFGWDYCHSYNDFNIREHIKNALEYFRSRGSRNEHR